MRKKLYLLSITAVFIIVFTSCSTQPQIEKIDYEETKKMVVDILKTDDGKKALKEVLKDEEMQQTLIMDQKIVTETIQDSLISEEGSKTIQKAFEDPKFVESYAKNLQKEHQDMIKSLMKDPEYQKMLIEIFQDPEMKKTMQTSIKSQEFRKHLQDIIIETLSSPLFKSKIEDTLLKAAQESGEQKNDEHSSQKNDEQQKSGHS